MKKISAIFLISLYMLSFTGLVINKFYCCGKLSSVSLFANNSYSKAEKEFGSGCCKTTKQSFKLKTQHISSYTAELTLKSITFLSIFFSYISPVIPSAFSKIKNAQQNAPPIYRANHSYLVNCSFRI